METRIMQIIPAPAGMEALIETGADDRGRITACGQLVSCLALCEVANGSGGTCTEVKAMVILPDSDTLGFASDCGGFLTLVHDARPNERCSK